MSDRARYWQRLLGAWEKSGLSQAEFYRRREVSAGSFAWWKRRLNETTKPTGRRVGRTAGRPGRRRHASFVEVALPRSPFVVGSAKSTVTPALDMGPGGYEIALNSGRGIRLKQLPKRSGEYLFEIIMRR